MRLENGNAKPGLELSRQRELIENIAVSGALQHSPALRKLAVYLWEETVREPHRELHEQDVGVGVFGRQPGYDTSADNIVRVQVSKLRKRLDEYFSGEGSHHTEIIEIPRGGYALVFRKRMSEKGLPSRSAWLLRWLPLAGCVVLALVCAWLSIDHVASSRMGQVYRTPAVRALWSSFFGSDPGATIVLPDTSIATFQDLTGRNLTLSGYLGQAYRKEADEQNFSPDLRAALRLLIARRGTSAEEIRVVRRVLDAGTAYRRNIAIVPSRDFQVRSAREQNFALIGGRKSNLWIELMEPAMNFRMIVGPAPTIIRNLKPEPGEPDAFVMRAEGLESHGYGLVALLPNLSHAGSVLMISGTDTGSVEAAGEFLTKERFLDQLWRRLGRPSVFPYFEAILEMRGLDRSAEDMKLLAFRLHSR